MPRQYRRVKINGRIVTLAMRMTYEKHGLDEASALITHGLTREQIEAVCQRRARITGDSETGFQFVEEEAST